MPALVWAPLRPEPAERPEDQTLDSCTRLPGLEEVEASAQTAETASSPEAADPAETADAAEDAAVAGGPVSGTSADLSGLAPGVVDAVGAGLDDQQPAPEQGAFLAPPSAADAAGAETAQATPAESGLGDEDLDPEQIEARSARGDTIPVLVVVPPEVLAYQAETEKQVGEAPSWGTGGWHAAPPREPSPEPDECPQAWACQVGTATADESSDEQDAGTEPAVLGPDRPGSGAQPGAEEQPRLSVEQQDSVLGGMKDPEPAGAAWVAQAPDRSLSGSAARSYVLAVSQPVQEPGAGAAARNEVALEAVAQTPARQDQDGPVHGTEPAAGDGLADLEAGTGEVAAVAFSVSEAAPAAQAAGTGQALEAKAPAVEEPEEPEAAFCEPQDEPAPLPGLDPSPASGSAQTGAVEVLAAEAVVAGDLPDDSLTAEALTVPEAEPEAVPDEPGKAPEPEEPQAGLAPLTVPEPEVPQAGSAASPEPVLAAAPAVVSRTRPAVSSSPSERPRSVLVTGASRGIGRAVVQAMLDAGEHVVGLSRSGEAPEGALGLATDVTDETALAEAVSRAEAEHGPVEVLVACAGIARDSLAARTSDATWEAMLDTDLTGVFRTVRAVLPQMMRARSGRIVLVSSVVASRGGVGQVAYGAAKAGVEGLVRSLARELAPRGITVNAVAPGFVTTDMTSSLPSVVREAHVAATPIGRMATTQEVAAPVVFLASPAASYITGTVLPVDGGLGMGR